MVDQRGDLLQVHPAEDRLFRTVVLPLRTVVHPLHTVALHLRMVVHLLRMVALHPNISKATTAISSNMATETSLRKVGLNDSRTVKHRSKCVRARRRPHGTHRVTMVDTAATIPEA